MTTQDYYNITADANGWRTLPDGSRFKLGDNVTIGKGVGIGNNTTIGNDTTIAKNTTIGKGVNIGSEVSIGNGVNIGDYVIIGVNATINDLSFIGNNAIIGTYARIGNKVMIGVTTHIGNYAHIGNSVHIYHYTHIGNYARIGENQTTETLNKYFISTYPEISIFWKWVTKDLMSTGWGSARPIAYHIGETIIESNAILSDKQCDIGLHVFRPGIRPEFAGLCECEHDLVCLEVEVKREDICFGGLPGNSDKLRVKKLKVLRKL